MQQLIKRSLVSVLMVLSPVVGQAAATANANAAATATEAAPVRLCVSNAVRYPYSFVEKNRVQGLHIDITAAALTNRHRRYQFFSASWTECLGAMVEGQADAIIGAGYSKEHSQFLLYPKGAKPVGDTPQRLTSADYAAVSRLDDDYDYTGGFKTLKPPVCVQSGYVIEGVLRAAGIKIIEKTKPSDCLAALATKEANTVVIYRRALPYVILHNDYFNQFYAHLVEVQHVSLYLAFSKKGRVSAAGREALWQSIQEIREDRSIMDTFWQRYELGKS